MTEPLFDIYLTGKLTPGTAPEQAVQRLAQLFKAPVETMQKLLTGKPQLLKKGLTREVALKYRQALQQAGVDVGFRQQAAADAAQPPAPAAPASPFATAEPARSSDPDARRPTGSFAPAQAAANPFSLAPAGADLLQEEERQSVPVAAIDTSALALAPQAPLPPAATPDVPAVAVDHLSLAPAGNDLLAPDERRPPASAYQLNVATTWQLEP